MTRNIFIALGIVIAVFGVGMVLRNVLFSEPNRGPVLKSLSDAAPGRVTPLTVRRIEGVVERRLADSGSWQPLSLNASVSERDSVRTDEGGSAVLSSDDGLEIELAELSELAVAELGAQDAKLIVERGRVGAAMGKRAGKLHVGARDSDAWVEADGGRFSVMRDGLGKVAVAVAEGDVAVTAQQTRVKVAAGEQSIVEKNLAPAPPVRIPPSLFLKVSRSGPSRVNQRSTELAGLTNPGAAVYVNGAPVSTDATGNFVAKVALKEGRNKLQITVRDALGRSERQQLPDVTVDTKPPKLKGKTVW